jgi:hypothetical protein
VDVNLTVRCFRDGFRCFFSCVKIEIVGGDRWRLYNRWQSCNLSSVWQENSMYYEAAIVTTHPKCSSYKTQIVAVFQEASTSDQCNKNLESGMNCSKTCVMQWWLQIFRGTNSKCQRFVNYLKSTARGKFQTNLLSARTTRMRVIRKRL